MSVSYPKVVITDETLRDGLQIEREGVALDEKLKLIDMLIAAGIKRLVVGAFVNPKYPDAGVQVRELQYAAGLVGRQIEILRVSTDAEIDAASATLVDKKASALLITQDIFFNSRREKLVM